MSRGVSMVERATRAARVPPRAGQGAPGVMSMRATMRKAGRATVQLLAAAAMAFGMYLFVTVLLITAVGTLAVIGCRLLPETVLLLRRIAGARRRLTAARTGREILEACRTIDGPLAGRLRTTVRDPGTRTDLRWMAAYYVCGALVLLALPLWPLGLVADGVGCGLVRRRAVVLPWIVRLADLEANWSTALLRPSLRVSVADEGRGGVDEPGAAGAPGRGATDGGGSGLLGVRRRVAALDGTVRVSSPVGGPTVIEVELPCVW